MINEEIVQLREMNTSRYDAAKSALYEEFIKMDDFLMEQFQKIAIHRHFKTRKEAREAMRSDFNPYNTFSFGRIDPSKKIDQIDLKENL